MSGFDLQRFIETLVLPEHDAIDFWDHLQDLTDDEREDPLGRRQYPMGLEVADSARALLVLLASPTYADQYGEPVARAIHRFRSAIATVQDLSLKPKSQLESKP